MEGVIGALTVLPTPSRRLEILLWPRVRLSSSIQSSSYQNTITCRVNSAGKGQTEPALDSLFFLLPHSFPHLFPLLPLLDPLHPIVELKSLNALRLRSLPLYI